jgi:hypothetical protein
MPFNHSPQPRSIRAPGVFQWFWTVPGRFILVRLEGGGFVVSQMSPSGGAEQEVARVRLQGVDFLCPWKPFSLSPDSQWLLWGERGERGRQYHGTYRTSQDFNQADLWYVAFNLIHQGRRVESFRNPNLLASQAVWGLEPGTWCSFEHEDDGSGSYRWHTVGPDRPAPLVALERDGANPARRHPPHGRLPGGYYTSDSTYPLSAARGGRWAGHLLVWKPLGAGRMQLRAATLSLSGSERRPPVEVRWPDGQTVADVALSRDGLRLAWSLHDANGKGASLMVTDESGNAPRSLLRLNLTAPDVFQPQDLQWSPDGSSVGFLTYDRITVIPAV